jgi:hypothetical protein
MRMGESGVRYEDTYHVQGKFSSYSKREIGKENVTWENMS